MRSGGRPGELEAPILFASAPRRVKRREKALGSRAHPVSFPNRLMNPAERRPPDALLILLSVLALAVALTWLVPAGEFRREQANGRQVLVAGSYQEVTAAPAPWQRFFTAPVAGFTDRDAARIIAFVLLIGGAFGVIEATCPKTKPSQDLKFSIPSNAELLLHQAADSPTCA